MRIIIRLTDGRFIFGTFLMLFSFVVMAVKWKYTAPNEETSTFILEKWITNEGVVISTSQIVGAPFCPPEYQLSLLPSPEEQYNVRLSITLENQVVSTDLQMVTGTDILRGQPATDNEYPQTVDHMNWIVSSLPILSIGEGRFFLPIVTRITKAASNVANDVASNAARYQVVKANFQIFNTKTRSAEECALSVIIDTRDHSVFGVSGDDFGDLWIEGGNTEGVPGTSGRPVVAERLEDSAGASRPSVVVERLEDPPGASRIYLPPGWRTK